MGEMCTECGKKIINKYQECKLYTIGSHASIYNMCDKSLIKKNFFKKNRELEMKDVVEILNKPYLTKIVYVDDNTIILSKINGINFNYFFSVYYDLDEDDKFSIFIKIYKMLLDLEKSGYNHLDISPGNIIIENDTKNIFLIDYESLTNDPNYYNEFMGSYGYVPPEKLLDNKFIFNKFDSYSFGMLLAEHIALNYHVKIINFKKKCNCTKNCTDLQSCINRKVNIILERIRSDRIRTIYQIILSNTLVLDYNKRKSFRELEILLKDFL